MFFCFDVVVFGKTINMWNKIVDYFNSNIYNILIFFSVFIVGIVFIKVLLKIINKMFLKSKIEKIAQNFFVRMIKFVLYLVFILVLLSIVGVKLTGILTALSAVILAIGVALQNNIANLANGIVIISSKMFKKDDYIIVGESEGSILSINFLFTTIVTPDNKKITIPNSTIVNAQVVNASYYQKRRVDINLYVTFETDIQKVKNIVSKIVKSNTKIYPLPKHICNINKLSQNGVEMFISFWCNVEDYWIVYYDVLENIYKQFNKNSIRFIYDFSKAIANSIGSNNMLDVNKKR